MVHMDRRDIHIGTVVGMVEDVGSLGCCHEAREARVLRHQGVSMCGVCCRHYRQVC